jgi:hypothetical protein
VNTRREIPGVAAILRRRAIAGAHESSDQSDASLPEPADWLHEVANILDGVSEHHRPAGFEDARRILFERAELALKRAKSEGLSIQLNPDEAGAMEALIALDGSRPSLALTCGKVNYDDPFIGKWKSHLQANESTISQCAACVGRIEAHRERHAERFGTGVLYDSTAGLVLTAAHVLRNLQSRLRHEQADGIADFDDGPVIDFRGEYSSDRRHRLKIQRGISIGASGSPYVDAAVLKVRPLTEAEAARSGDTVEDIPAAATLRLTASGDQPVIAGSFCTIGYPDKAPKGSYTDATGSGNDWFAIVEHLLGGSYGIKRLAPGLPLSQPDVLSENPAERRFGHDATTLFGSSGSPLFAWNDRNHPVFGIHVTGAVLVSNFAEWVPCFSDRLRMAGDKISRGQGS